MRAWLASIVLVVLAAAVPTAVAAGERGSMMKHHPMSMGGSAESHEAMMEEMRARQQKLDELVAAMEAAEGEEKVEAVAAVVKEMVAQRKARMERMETMHERMMERMHEAESAAEEERSEEGHGHED